MTAAVPREAHQPAAGAPGGLPSALLSRLLEAAVLDEVPGPDAGPAPPRDATGDTTWQEQLERACAPYPLRLRQVFLTVREAVGAANSRTPLVGYRSDGPGWFALLGRSRGRAGCAFPDAPERWLGPAQLALRLGAAGPDAVLPWVLVEPSLPAHPEAAKPVSLSPLRRLSRLVRPDRGDLWAIVLYAALVGALTLATPIAVQQLVNTVAFGGLVQPVVVLALLLFGGLAFSALLSVLQAYVAELIQRRVFVRVAMDVAARLTRVSAGAFDSKHGPELVNRIFDVFTVQKIGAILLLEGTSVVLQTVVGLLVLSFYHPLMLAFSILLLGGIAFLALVLGRGAVRTAIGESNAKYAMVSWMEELVRHPGTFRNPGGRQYAVERADQLASGYVNARRRHYRIVLRQLSGALGIQVLAGSAVLALGGGLVVAGQLTLGQLVASELIITAIAAAVAKLGKQFESFYDLLAAVDKLGVLFDLPLERQDGAPVESPSGPAAVEMHGVSFSYGKRSVLKDFSVRIEPGERVMLTGPAGAGKSTLLDLMMGVREPDGGYITLDGHDLRDMRLNDLREQVALVGDLEIFPGSVLDNVRVGKPWLPTSKVRDALERVGILDEIRELPDGLQTELSTDGAPLSDGQRAALMLARAIAAQPRLLLLDDGLVLLELDAREHVFDALFAPEAPWTLVAVSDLASLRARCTRVVELPPRSGGLS
jgi:ABC-type bacteriocin/lantibiotic exporter with double-glycine peptidase domain